MDIGGKIKQLRLQRDLTQEELASRCELTKGYISQLENDLCSPSIATLVDILNVLGVPLSSFFADKQDEQIAFGKDDFFHSETESAKLIWLVPNSQKNKMEPIILVLEGDGCSQLREPFDGEEFGYVLEGRVVVEILDSGRKVKVGKGESFYLDGKYTHKISCASKTGARVLWVATPSNF